MKKSIEDLRIGDTVKLKEAKVTNISSQKVMVDFGGAIAWVNRHAIESCEGPIPKVGDYVMFSEPLLAAPGTLIAKWGFIKAISQDRAAVWSDGHFHDVNLRDLQVVTLSMTPANGVQS